MVTSSTPSLSSTDPATALLALLAFTLLRAREVATGRSSGSPMDWMGGLLIDNVSLVD